MSREDESLAARDWRRLRQLLERALELPADERDAFVEREAPGDEAERLRRLIALDARTGLLEPPATPAAPAGPHWAGRERIGPYRVKSVLETRGRWTRLLALRDDGEFHRRVQLLVARLGEDERSSEVFQQLRARSGVLATDPFAALYGSGVENGELAWLAFEWIEGRPLLEHARREELAPLERLELAIQLCEAAERLQREGVSPRALEAEAVRVDERGRTRLAPTPSWVRDATCSTTASEEVGGAPTSRLDPPGPKGGREPLPHARAAADSEPPIGLVGILRALLMPEAPGLGDDRRGELGARPADRGLATRVRTRRLARLLDATRGPHTALSHSHEEPDASEWRRALEAIRDHRGASLAPVRVLPAIGLALLRRPGLVIAGVLAVLAGALFLVQLATRVERTREAEGRARLEARRIEEALDQLRSAEERTRDEAARTRRQLERREEIAERRAAAEALLEEASRDARLREAAVFAVARSGLGRHAEHLRELRPEAAAQRLFVELGLRWLDAVREEMLSDAPPADERLEAPSDPGAADTAGPRGEALRSGYLVLSAHAQWIADGCAGEREAEEAARALAERARRAANSLP